MDWRRGLTRNTLWGVAALRARCARFKCSFGRICRTWRFEPSPSDTLLNDKARREAENYGGSKLARDMLPVYDNLKRALEAAGDEQKAAASALIEGVELTMRELLNVFKKHGIEVITPDVGDKFDPQLHEAMFEAPVPGTKAGEIIQVSAEGFMLHDRLLRPAQVGVSSAPG